MQQHLLRSLILAGFGLLALPSATLACDFFSDARLAAVFQPPTAVVQRSQLPERCDFRWDKADAAAITAANAEALRESMRRNSPPYQAERNWNQVIMERLFVAESEAQAQAYFAQGLQREQSESFGSPDPLANLSWQPVQVNQGQAAWNPTGLRLLRQDGNQVWLLHVAVEQEPEKNLEWALKLAAALSAS